ncbi:MAG: DMT family transporter [Gammaproteobacteria bacterium]
MSTSISRRSAWLLIGLLIFIWGGNWPAMKIGLSHVPPLTFASLRLLTSAMTMLVLAFFMRDLGWPQRRDWPFLLAAGGLQMGVYIAMLTYGIQYVPAGRASILAYTMPVWVVPGAIILLGERLNRWNAMGFLLGIGGLMVLFNPTAFDWSDGDVLLGNGLIVGGAAISGLVMLYIRGRQWVASPLALAPWQFILASLFLVPLALFAEPNTEIQWTPQLLMSLTYSGPLATAMGMLIFVAISRALPAITASMGLLGVPVVGLLLSSWILGESLTLANITGLTLIVTSVAAVSWGGRRN